MLYSGEMVETSLPHSTEIFFQEYHFVDLDLERDQSLIIERLLAYGSRPEIQWLFQRYKTEAIRIWVDTQGHRLLPRSRYHLWCVILDLPPKPKQSPIWPH